MDVWERIIKERNKRKKSTPCVHLHAIWIHSNYSHCLYEDEWKLVQESLILYLIWSTMCRFPIYINLINALILSNTTTMMIAIFLFVLWNVAMVFYFFLFILSCSLCFASPAIFLLFVTLFNSSLSSHIGCLPCHKGLHYSKWPLLYYAYDK